MQEKLLSHGFSACTGDNPLAKARGSSPRKDGQTVIQLLLLKSQLNVLVNYLSDNNEMYYSSSYKRSYMYRAVVS